MVAPLTGFPPQAPTPRIPDDVIARLKREVDLKAVVERSGVTLRRQGEDWVGSPLLRAMRIVD